MWIIKLMQLLEFDKTTEISRGFKHSRIQFCVILKITDKITVN